MKRITKKVSVLYGIEMTLGELIDELCDKSVGLKTDAIDGFGFIYDDEVTVKVGNKTVKLSDVKIRITGDSFQDLE